MAVPTASEATPGAGRGPMAPRPFRVAGRRQETEDTWTLALEPADGGPVAELGPGQFNPGQFNMVYAFGVGEVPISISGDPGAGGPLEHTVRAVGPVSAAICRAEPGEQLGVRGPFGSSWPLAGAAGRHVVIVAGGIGLAPLRPALLRALAERERLAGLVLLCGGRSPSQLLFRSELEAWRDDPRLELGVTVDSAEAGWLGNVGVVTTLIGGAPFDPANAVAFTVGPEVMMRFTVDALLDRGMSPADVHVSIERNMKCAVTQCGRCQFGPTFACREGPVMSYGVIEPFFRVREL
jgi:NAD(P)H-flavin reductase